MKRKREKVFFDYECSITAEHFRTSEPAPTPKELTSIKAYYELHPENDDRPAIIKKRAGTAELAPTPTEDTEENDEDGN